MGALVFFGFMLVAVTVMMGMYKVVKPFRKLIDKLVTSVEGY